MEETIALYPPLKRKKTKKPQYIAREGFSQFRCINPQQDPELPPLVVVETLRASLFKMLTAPQEPSSLS